jgi:hypothetical protein
MVASISKLRTKLVGTAAWMNQVMFPKFAVETLIIYWPLAPGATDRMDGSKATGGSEFVEDIV